MNNDIVVLNCQKCYLCLTDRRSSVSAESRTVVSVVNNVSVVSADVAFLQVGTPGHVSSSLWSHVSRVTSLDGRSLRVHINSTYLNWHDLCMLWCMEASLICTLPLKHCQRIGFGWLPSNYCVLTSFDGFCTILPVDKHLIFNTCAFFLVGNRWWHTL